MVVMRKKWLWIGMLAAVCLGVVGYVYVSFNQNRAATISPLSLVKELPLEKYSIVSLQNRTFTPTPIVFDEVTATTSSYTVQMFHFEVEGKKVTGLAHLPMTPESRKMPVVVQFRGFAPKETYTSGVGTQHSAEVYAKNGFISLAPDFLGYGGSDMPGDETVFEERFQTYTTALQLLSSIQTIPFADPTHIFVWGHSNGGQIALTVATILGGRARLDETESKQGYPTTLWAPVSKAFPYNILAYTDEFDDGGRALRKELSKFENDYDTDAFSFTNYLASLTVPLQIHQGQADIEVPVWWSDEFVSTLKREGKPVRYFTYPGMDHNMSGGWDTIVQRDIDFFRANF